MDNQQGSTIQHKELCSMLCGNLDGREVWGRMDTIMKLKVKKRSNFHLAQFLLPFLEILKYILLSVELCPLPPSTSFPDVASGKEPACQCRRNKRRRLNPWVGKIPWRRTWQPTPLFLPGESNGQGDWQATAYWGANSWTLS